MCCRHYLLKFDVINIKVRVKYFFIQNCTLFKYVRMNYLSDVILSRKITKKLEYFRVYLRRKVNSEGRRLSVCSIERNNTFCKKNYLCQISAQWELVYLNLKLLRFDCVLSPLTRTYPCFYNMI